MQKKVALLSLSLLCTWKSQELFSAVIPSQLSIFGHINHHQVQSNELNDKSPILSNIQELRVDMDNGIRAIIHSDPVRTKSTLSMTVGCGYVYDQDNNTNLSHLAAHIIQLSSSNSCKRLIDLIKNETVKMDVIVDYDKTTYVLQSNTENFEEVIGSFASAITQPKFIPEDIQRSKIELKYEYDSRIKDDKIKCEWIRNEVYSPDSPLNKFNPGKETENIKITTEQVEKWFKSNYVGQNITISVISPIPMEKLRNNIINTFESVKFSPTFKNEQCSYPSIFRTQEPALLYVCTDKQKSLEIEWEIGQRNDDLKSIPQMYPEWIVAQIISHKAKNGIERILRESGFANNVDAYVIPYGNNVHGRFRICVDLTLKGIREWPLVASEILGTLEIISTTKIPQYILEESSLEKNIKQQIMDRSDERSACIEESKMLFIEDLKTFPEKSSNFDQTLWKESLNSCLHRINTKSNMLITLSCSLEEWKKAHDGLEEKSAWLLLTPQKRFSNCHWIFRTLQELPKPILCKNFLPPPKNILMTTNITKQKPEKYALPPKKIMSIKQNPLIFCKDFVWNQHKSAWSIIIDLPQVDTCPGSASTTELIELYINTIREATSSVTYLASKAGININFDVNQYKQLLIKVDGPSSHILNDLIEALIIGIKNITVSEEIFGLAHKKRIKNLQQICFEKPSDLGINEIKSILQDGFGIEQRIEDLTDLSFIQLNSFITRAKSVFYLQGSYFGNMNEHEVKVLWDKICIHSVDEKPVSDESLNVLKTSYQHQSFEPITSLSKGSATVLAIDVGINNVENIILQKILKIQIEEFTKQIYMTCEKVHEIKVKCHQIREKLYIIISVESSKNTNLIDKLVDLIDQNIEEMQKNSDSYFPNFTNAKMEVLQEFRSPIKNNTDITDLISKPEFLSGDIQDLCTKILSISPLVEFSQYLKFIKDHMSKETRQIFSIFINGLPVDLETNYMPCEQCDVCSINLIKKQI